MLTAYLGRITPSGAPDILDGGLSKTAMLATYCAVSQRQTRALERVKTGKQMDVAHYAPARHAPLVIGGVLRTSRTGLDFLLWLAGHSRLVRSVDAEPSELS
jgi:hypothetical protein